jgi:hypothetical protein
MKLKKFIQFNENMDMNMDMNVDMQHEHDSETTYYMFFENLQTIKRCIEEIMSLDETEIDEILASGHDWASDHISTAKEDVEQVHNFLVNNTKHEDQMEHEMGYDSDDYDDMDMHDEGPMTTDMYLDDEEYDNMPDDTEYED